MRVLVLDLETTTKWLDDKTRDGSPFNPDNRIVSAHWAFVEDGQVGPVERSVFFHKDRPHPDPPTALQAALDAADRVVAHNAKFDLQWLEESGFRVPKDRYCTLIGEYLLNRGQRKPLSLEEVAIRRGVSLKKADLIHEWFHVKKTCFSEIPIDIVTEYADADVVSCAEIYLKQVEDYRGDSKGLTPVLKLSMEMLEFLMEIEKNGIMIDRDALDKVEREFQIEKEKIEKRLNEIVADVMGDTPINLSSGKDMTMVVYSRAVIDRNKHIETWNIGVDARGKPNRPPRMTDAQFVKAVRNTTRKITKTSAIHCEMCKGRGFIRKVKKNGEPHKNTNKCTFCTGRGFILMDTGQKAGLGLNPEGPEFASINGFKADKVVIKRLINQAEGRNNLIAVEFLKGLMRLNAVDTYLDSFVGGMKRWTRSDGILHARFNQAVTATGRLSSSDPNMQNQPKDKKFPIRKAIVSRFKNGKIVECDFSGLEFRVAGELSRDPQIIRDVLDGKDIHSQTASIINQIDQKDVTKDQRQGAKAYSFAPLYGGQGGSEPPHVQAYFREFFVIYEGLAKYQKTLMDGTLKDGLVRIPSGREYKFENVKRLGNGRVTNATMIVNYPIQGWATGDLVPLACIRALRAFRKFGLRSKLVLTVHDSIVADCHPDEIDQVKECLAWAMTGVPTEVKKRWGYEMVLPLNIEIEGGPNWGETTDI